MSKMYEFNRALPFNGTLKCKARFCNGLSVADRTLKVLKLLNFRTKPNSNSEAKEVIGRGIMPVVSQSEISACRQYAPADILVEPSVIRRIRDWLTGQTHLPSEHITDDDITLAHHCCDYSTELTKKVIDLNYTLRSLLSFYRDRKIDDSVKSALQTWLITPLKSKTKKGYSAVYCQLLDADPTKFIYADVVRAFVMVIDLWLSQEAPAPGTALIVNLDRVALAHLSRIDLNVAQQFFYFLQEAMFFNLKEFHFINAPSFIDTLMSMVRPFMKKELLDVLKVHQVGAVGLDEHVPVADLPKDNDDGQKMAEEVWKRLKANEKFFDDESKLRVDESKRRGGPQTLSTFFPGLEGTFKKLEID